MKNYFSLCSFLIVGLVAVGQDSHYDRLRNLSKVWIRSNEDAWAFFRNNDLKVNDYKVAFDMYNDSLIVFEEDYNSSEYDQEYIKSYFKIYQLTSDELVIHPLNAAAVQFLDPEARYNGSAASRKIMYKTYLNELKAADKDQVKRNAILSRYKTKYDLDVDIVSFKPESYFVERVKIDSVDVSLTWQVGLKEGLKRIEYNNLRWVKATNSYIFGYQFEDRKVEIKATRGTIEFIPPLVTDDEVFREPKTGKGTPQDSLIRILNEAPAGWYTGKFASEGFSFLETALQKYGVNRPHQIGDKAHCKYAVRVYHEGKYTDYYRNDWEEPPYLLEDFFLFLDSWPSYVKTFEELQGKTVFFPIALKK